MDITYTENYQPTLTQSLSIIKQFRTKKEALSEGKKYGWSSALHIEKRFETVWIVGSKDFQNENEGDLSFEVYRLPLLQWTIENGIKINKVLKMRKYIKT